MNAGKSLQNVVLKLQIPYWNDSFKSGEFNHKF